MTEKIINGTKFRFENDKVYNGLEYCVDYMYKEENDGSILIETPRNEETINSKLKDGWKKLTTEFEFEKEGIIVLELRGKTHIYSSNFTFPVPLGINDFIRVYVIHEFKHITVEGSCYYDGTDPVNTWATIE